jgi:hypothetical protein
MNAADPQSGKGATNGDAPESAQAAAADVRRQAAGQSAGSQRNVER